MMQKLTLSETRLNEFEPFRAASTGHSFSHRKVLQLRNAKPKLIHRRLLEALRSPCKHLWSDHGRACIPSETQDRVRTAHQENAGISGLSGWRDGSGAGAW